LGPARASPAAWPGTTTVNRIRSEMSPNRFALFVTVFVATMPLLAVPAAAEAPAFVGGSWLLLSDIHFSPFADPKLADALVAAPASDWHGILARGSATPSTYGEATNFALLESALDEMRRVELDPPVVIIAGDSLAHEFPETFQKLEPGRPENRYDAFVDKTMAFLAFEFNARFPRAQFVITIGNNDGYCGDYRSTPDSQFLAHMAQAWAPLVDRNRAAPDFVRTFETGGYYTATLPTRVPGKIVAVNSVVWSAIYENGCGVRGSDPGRDEFSWLKLAAAPPPGGYRWFLSHIPPTIDAYDSVQAHLPIGFLHDRDAAQLLDLIVNAPGHTPEAIVGHTHHSSFAIFGQGPGAVPGLVLPSISPVQGNNPAFVAATVEQSTGRILDASTYALLLGASSPVWTRLYSFRSAYGLTAFDAPSLEMLQADLIADRRIRASFSAYYTSFSLHGGIDPATWAWYWCANDNFTSVSYAACVARSHAYR
jgi:sphingomyelin phosphodiesterase acid-like 3